MRRCSFLGDHSSPSLLAWKCLVLSKLGRRVEAARKPNSYRFFKHQKWGGGRNSSCPAREPAASAPETQARVVLLAGPGSFPRLAWASAPELLAPEHLQGAWPLGMEEGAGGAVSRGQREEQKSVGGRSAGAGEGSHSWGCHGRDVVEGENPNPEEAKSHWCCSLWDDLLNAGTLLSGTISSGILTAKHCFGMKGNRGKKTQVLVFR